MNKYQEAYGRIIYISNLTIYVKNGLPMNQYTKDVLLVQELVDKATPIKPIQVRKAFKNIDLSMFDCPNCNLGVMPSYYPPGLNDYCSHCGQRLDWSNDGPTK